MDEEAAEATRREYVLRLQGAIEAVWTGVASDAVGKRCVQTAKRLVDNLVERGSSDPRVRRLRAGNALVQGSILDVPGGSELLRAVGWEEGDDGGWVYPGGGDGELSQLLCTAEVIDGALFQLTPSAPRRAWPRYAVPPAGSAPSRCRITPGSAPRREGACGLANLGNTCYMAAVLQCVSHLAAVRRGLLARLAADDAGAEAEQQQQQQEPLWPRAAGVARQLALLLADLWSAKWEWVAPRGLRDALCQTAPRFRGWTQHDSHELLQALLAALEAGTSPAPPAEGGRRCCEHQPSAATAAAAAAAAAGALACAAAAAPPSGAPTDAAAWALRRAMAPSPVAAVFDCLIGSQLRCGQCGCESTSIDPAQHIAAPLPAAGPAPTALEDCLRLHGAAEVLSGADAWDCPRCGCQREATKHLRLRRAPQCLVIQLKRFAYDVAAQRRSKISAPVSYPVRGLDMGEHCDGAGPLIYDLTGVVCHVGAAQGGHYTALCADLTAPEPQWCRFDDARVTPVAAAEVEQRQTAYLLFYHLRDCSGAPPG
eukprot:TRINITY_DN14274_c0_g1_i1.p1 TRINITY_DN14274_c0_g1~~TRINITY_DN14274_c0_g1_i1.p1  ORF type:complete len:540 (+),score=151.73 TRINITY_DN14274_c0_g1_i1:68-1687(+)